MRQVLITLIRGYQRFLSPLKPPTCRFYPTCSSYSIEALRVHGVIRGCYLTVWRLLRCQPFCAGGEDPVPPHQKIHTASFPTARADKTDPAKP